MQPNDKPTFNNALGIDVGEKRIGIARVNSVAKLPEPLATIKNDASFTRNLNSLITKHGIDLLVVGLPRNMYGQETAQTQTVRQFVNDVIKKHTNLQVYYQDETLTSVAAESTNSTKVIEKFGVDALAAVEILNGFIGVIR